MATLLRDSLAAHGTPEFEIVLARELAALGPEGLGLHRALCLGNAVLEDDPTVMILRVQSSRETIDARIGVAFSSTIAGCACADDPTPENVLPEYGEFDISVDRRTGVAVVTPAQ